MLPSLLLLLLLLACGHAPCLLLLLGCLLLLLVRWVPCLAVAHTAASAQSSLLCRRMSVREGKARLQMHGTQVMGVVRSVA